MRGNIFLLRPAQLLTTTLTLLTSISAQSVATNGIYSNTTVATTTAVNPTVANSTVTNSTVSNAIVANTILVFARDTASAVSATSGLQGYGIPFELVIVPATGITLPTLNSSSSSGNYGGIITLSELSYDLGAAGWGSAITTTQWQQLYAYQQSFGIRMVRLDVYPGPDFGTTTAVAGAGCCDAGVEQLVSISNATGFPTANLKVGAGMSTEGLWHYPATITDPATTWEVAQFAAAGSFSTVTSAAVINNFGGRQQMVWFSSWATDWSPTSNFLQHAYIHWMTRGLFVGYRRIYFNTQVDDMHLSTELYSPAGVDFRARPADLTAHVTWQTALNKRLPAGSKYMTEIGHNGNGDIESAVSIAGTACKPADAIEYPDQIDTALEFQKPLGTGVDIWPAKPATYTWTLACAIKDPLLSWFRVAANRNAFAHISHTFSHSSLDNSTYSDANKEIVFNVAWLNQVGLSAAPQFSSKGIIPPAITGLHNGDVIRAWMTNGIVNVVGDNTRPVLLNTENEFWPLVSTVAANGYDGLTIMPRWATTIYYNCDTPACTLAEWIATSAGSGDFTALLNDARKTNTRHLLGLHHDAFMFHQANMRASDMPSVTIGSQTGNFSLLQQWVETVLQEMTRLTTWPIISIKHDDSADQFNNRMARDKCNPNLKYTYSADGKSITGVTVTANGNTCSTKIPVTFPGAATSTSSPGATSEQIGTDPLTIWITLSGSPVTYTLTKPIAI